MGYKIKQLYDYRKNRPVLASDIDESSFSDVEEFSVNGEKFRFYCYQGGSSLIQDDYVKDKVIWEGSLEDSPVIIYTNVGGRLKVKDQKLAKRLYNEFGEGRYNIVEYGGDRNIDYPFKLKFIEKVEEDNNG